MRKRIFSAFVAVAALLALVAGCSRGPSTGPLKIAYLPITHALPLFAVDAFALDAGEARQVELVKFGSWTELSDALLTGAVDGAVVLAELAVKARAIGMPVKAVALGHHDGNVVVVANDVNDVKDLKGKTVAIPHRLSTHNVLLEMILRRADLTVKDVNVVELTPPEMPAALAQGRIAAYIVAEPFGAKAIVTGIGKALYTSPEVWPGSVCCTLVLNTETTATREDDVAKFLKAYQDAAEAIADDPEKAGAVAARYLTVPPPVLKQSLAWIDFHDLRLARTEYDELAKWMVELKLLKEAPAYADFVDGAAFANEEK